MRRASSEALWSIGAIGLVLTLLIAFDGQLRKDVEDSVRQSRAPTELTDAGYHARDLMTVVVKVVKTESHEHQILMVFMLAATALTLFMFRT